MTILRYIEWGLSQLLYRARGHDAKLFTNHAIFNTIPQNIRVESPELGPSGSHLTINHSKLGSNRFPRLKWSLVTTTPTAGSTGGGGNGNGNGSGSGSGSGISESDIQEYILICEDADSPLPTPGNHGLYFAIPPTKTEVGPEDFEIDADRADEGEWLKGGFRLGKNHRGTVYIGPRPPVGHGEHRYFFQVVALKERVDTAAISPVPSREELLEQIKGKVIGWGVWVGIFENRW